MFIELTDHLRCPADHDEAYLVLLPGSMDGRSVREGDLGCPVCGRAYEVRNGVAEFGEAEPAAVSGTELSPEAMTAFLSLGGPGGYLAYVGLPGASWREVLELNAGIAPVAVNPPASVEVEYPLSVLRGSLIPLRSRTMRGVVLGPGYAADAHWLDEAVRVLLPGLRLVGEGPPPERPDLDVLGSAAGCWVATKANR